MGIPIFASKLSPPPLPAAYFPRERLDRLWEAWGGRRLILVSAGAGFGKTSFLAARARALAPRSLWYSVDETDTDLASLLAHLVRLADSRAPDAPAGERDAVAVSAAEVLVRLAQALRARGPGALLVVDDIHLLAESAEAQQFLARLIRFVPEGATLVLASREPIELGTAKPRSQGSVAALAADELKLTREEVAALFQRRFAGAPCDEEALRSIADHTEGWAAGVEIFLQSLESGGSAEIRTALERVSAAGPGWFAYFAEEVLRRIEPQVQDFICRAALLPRLDAGLCDQALGRQDSRRVLERLCRQNLFTVGTAGGGSGYRYHRLFREFLREQAHRRLSPAVIRQIHRRAARALLRAGAWADALTASIEGGDVKGALRLMDRVGEGLLVAGQYRAIEGVLDLLPAAETRKHPGALYILGRLADIRARWPEAHAHYMSALRLTTAGPRRVELLRLLGRLDCRWGRYARALVRFRHALAAAGPGDRLARAGVLVQAGVAESELGRLDESDRLFEEAIEIYHRHGAEFGEARGLCLLAANTCFSRGEFRRGRDAIQRALAIYQNLGDRRQVCYALCLLADQTLLAGDRHGAHNQASEALRLAEAIEYPSTAAHAHHTLGQIALIEADLASAEEHLEATVRIGEGQGELEFAVNPRLALALVLLARGNRHAAKRMCLRAHELARTARAPWAIGRCHRVLGRLERAGRPSGRGARGDHRHYRRAEALFRRMGALHELHHTLLLRLVSGDVPARRRAEALRELLAGVAHCEHHFLLREIEPEAGAIALVAGLRQGIEVDYAGAQLMAIGPRAVPLLEPLLRGESRTAQRRAAELLAQIGGPEARAALRREAAPGDRPARPGREAPPAPAGAAVPSLRIRALGRLEVQAGPTRLTPDGWRSARAQRLFLLLLVHRFRWVPRDVILETLWPDIDPDKGVNNLRQAIHVLRRRLEPDLYKTMQSHYVLFRNEACRLDPGEDCSYDVADLEAILQQADREWHAGQRARIRDQFVEALALYKGDFLAESPYEEFAAAEREHLRDRVLRACGRLMELRAAAQEWGELAALGRRAITLDPYRESHYHHLVLSLLRLGRKREALAGWREYETMMITEMGLPPSERMRALAEEVGTAP